MKRLLHILAAIALTSCCYNQLAHDDAGNKWVERKCWYSDSRHFVSWVEKAGKPVSPDGK